MEKGVTHVSVYSFPHDLWRKVCTVVRHSLVCEALLEPARSAAVLLSASWGPLGFDHHHARTQRLLSWTMSSLSLACTAFMWRQWGRRLLRTY